MRTGFMTLGRFVIGLCLAFVGQGAAGELQDLKREEKALSKALQQKEQQVQAVKAKLRDMRKRMLELKRKGSVSINSTQFHLPKLKTAPTIDGKVEEDEWAGAIGVPLTTGIYGMFKRPSSYFFVGWDEEHLYFGQRLPMREGEKPLRLNREPKHDNVYCGETSVEAYVDRKSHGSHGSGCRWQFMGNAVGNRWEREEQYEIGQNFIAWDGAWEYKQRLTPDGQFWEAEIAIPRNTVYQEEPLKDGDLWWIGMATNLHRPWCFSGFYKWRIPATFKEETPQIRMFHPERSIDARGIMFDMEIQNTTTAPFRAELVTRLVNPKEKDAQKQVLFEKVRPIDLAVGKQARFEVNDVVGDKAKDRASYRIAIIVRQGDKSVYTWSYPIRYNHPQNIEGLAYTPDPSKFPLKAAYNPLSNYVRVIVDRYDYEQRDKVAACGFLVKPQGAEDVISRGAIETFRYGKGETRVPVPADLGPGTYVCEAQMLDAKGAVMDAETATFVRKDHEKEFPWLFDQDAVGEDDILVEPFAPLAVDGNKIEAFQKTITVSGTGLPAAIEAAGVNLLRSPVVLEGAADGQAFTFAATADAPELVAGSATQAVYRGRAQGGPLRVATDVRWEFDSTARVRLTVAPADGKAELEALRLVIPFSADGAFHYIANGENMRLSNQCGRIPGEGETGRVWSSTSVVYQKMTVGSFVPFLWLGNRRSGITWFADSDCGWWPSDETPAIEMLRDKQGRVSLVLNLCSAPVTFATPREIVFGLNVNPVRPYSDHRGSSMTFGFLTQTGRWDPETSKGKVYARRYPENPALNKKYIDRSHHFHKIYAPYTEMSAADFEPEVFNYFREEWSRAGMHPGAPFLTETANDYLSWLFDRWVQDCGVDGLYVDNVMCKLTRNTANGAYELPDGRVQPSYNLWGYRENIKRVRTILQQRKNGKPFRICIHNTRFQFAPIMGFADLAMGGEMATPRGDNPGAGDFMDMYPRGFMDVMYNQPLWGYKQNHLYHFRWNSYQDENGEVDLDAAMKVHRGAMATMLVHGVEFFQGIKWQPFLRHHFQMIKSIAGGRLTFLPQWGANGLFRLEGAPEDQAVAIWKGEDVLLVVVANYAKRPARPRVWLDFAKLLDKPGKRQHRAILDFETLGHADRGLVTEREFPDDRLPRLDGGADATLHIPNVLRLKVEPRDFRAVLIANLPLGGKGSGF